MSKTFFPPLFFNAWSSGSSSASMGTFRERPLLVDVTLPLSRTQAGTRLCVEGDLSL